MQPIITVICPFTRVWAVERWVKDLESTNLDKERTNLCFIIDIDEPRILRALKQLQGYRSFYYIMNRENQPNEVRIAVRRERIATVMNQFKELIAKTDGDIILGLEDDTAFTGADLSRLYRIVELDDEVGFVEGVQCGRWGVKMIGAWKLDDIDKPAQIETLLPNDGLEEIDGGGYYGFATRRDLFMDHEHKWSGEVYGPDVDFVLSIRRKGYRCFVDWDLVFEHNDYNVLIRADENVTKIVYNLSEDGNWQRTDYENTPSN
jgi:hypothetical protein